MIEKKAKEILLEMCVGFWNNFRQL
jgi:hypothetical protein